MIFFKLKKYVFWAVLPLVAFNFTSCFKDLNTKVTDPDQLTAEAIYKDVSSYQSVLAKIYAGLALSGQQGAAGDSDISGIDEGFGQYLRVYWQMQELPTDEVVLGWSDAGLPELLFQTWGVLQINLVYATYTA